MKPIEHFHFCPKCGHPLAPPVRPNVIQCHACGFCYYFNPTVSAAAIILDPQGRALFIRRAKVPAKGKLSIPGGFVDYDENAEAGLRREIREEVGIEVGALEFLCSGINAYEYKEVTYPVVDFFFVTQAMSTAASALDGVESCVWLEPAKVNLEEIAFPSVCEALRRFLARGSTVG